MDLRRLKTIFICVLAVLNLILLIVLNTAKSYEKEERKVMAENLSGILAKNMIYLPENVELPDSPDISNFYLEKMFGSAKEMAATFLGKDFEEESKGNYKSEIGTLSVEGDEFKFHKSNPADEVSDFNAEKVEKLCRKEMEILGMMQDVYSFEGLNFVENGVKAIFSVKQEDAEFFDAYISFDVSNRGVFSITGKNIISDLNVSGGVAPYYSVASILADIVKSKRLDKNIAHTVVSIRPGYYIGKSEESYRNILAIPVWQIATDNGTILHYDARNGKEIAE